MPGGIRPVASSSLVIYTSWPVAVRMLIRRLRGSAERKREHNCGGNGLKPHGQ